VRPLPAAAWYAPRKRWRADRLLDALLAEYVDGCGAIVGVTQDDISTTRDDAHPDWGILGLAYLGDRVAVVSSFRARRRVPVRVAAQRLVKVANHELGHVLGLPHGGAPGCIMNDAGGSVRAVDREHGTLCDDERAQVEQKIGAVPARTAIDWRSVLVEL
jgi:archaemetzincin